MDLFSPPSSSLQEDLMHSDVLFWDFSPELFDLVSTNPYLLSLPSKPPPPPPPPPVVRGSAFARYVRLEARVLSGCSSSLISNERNIHRRLIGFLRRIPRDGLENRAKAGGMECTRGFRHMMSERQRRERLSQSYADLHSILPYRSKGDKNSIVQSAAVYVRELKGVKEELVRRNEELELRSARNSNVEGQEIKIRVAADHESTLDSMIGALQCLKAMDVKARSVRTDFSDHEFTAVMTIASKEQGMWKELRRQVEEDNLARGECS